MATFSSASKSNRLLQSKRYTLADFDSQEAYTNVLDLNASEIFIETESLPTSSLLLPYSGSSQDSNFITSGSGVDEINIARYYYQIELSPTTVVTSGKLLTWFAISGSSNEIGYDFPVSPQTIQPTQMVNWVSNKYIDPIFAANKAETPAQDPGSGEPGYNAYIRKGALGSADKVADNDVVFDYKTGILQWMNATNAPNANSASTNKMFLTAYQYVGQTLNQFIASGSGGGGGGTPGGANTQIQFNDSNAFGGSPRLIFNSTTGKTTVSGSLIISGSDSEDVFLIKSGSTDIAKVDQNGNFILVERTGDTPTAVAGGIMYSSSAFYVGIE
jgi:hypothetical protein